MTTFKKVLLYTFCALPTVARADTCPPSVDAFDTWTWLKSANSGDAWVTGEVCANAVQRDTIKNFVATFMGLYSNWDEWEGMLSGNKICNPDNWGARVINGGWVTELVGMHRDNESFHHFASPGGTLPDGANLELWLSQYVAYYVSDEGFGWSCLGGDDEPGPDDGFLFASNPWDNSACSVYYPWFWNQSVLDRAGTIVHEATHEFAGHVDDDACDNGGSCDDYFMNANAQTFNVIFGTHAVDAYQKRADGELEVVNFGNDVCGYLPLVPDMARFAQVQSMRSRLRRCFENEPPESAYPDAAVIDSVPGTLYDLSGDPGGQANTAYRIDITNSSRWACDKVCNRNDYVFNANGNSGPRACNEVWQPGNAAINAANRARCDDLNAEVAAGVTPEEHTSLRSQVYYMQPCVPGISEAYLAEVCDDLIPGADHVNDIDQAWPLPENIGYGYSAEEAIRDCQVTFCGRQDLAAWNAQAEGVCYEWDDPAGCLDLLCGDLDDLVPDPGRASQTYLESVICRASELGRSFGLREDDVGCQAVFNDCHVRETYMPLWEAQLAGGECWSENIQGDPLHWSLRRQVGTLTPGRFAAADRGPGLLQSECIAEEAFCEAMEAAMRAIAARIAKLKTRDRFPWEQPPGPDPWERLDRRAQVFDRDFERALIGLADRLEAGGVGPLWRDAEIRRAGAMPEAQVALAELIGHDTWFRIGGARRSAHLFDPRHLRQYGGRDAQADPYGLSTEGFEDELAALQTFVERTSTRQWNALISQAPRLGAEAYYTHLTALLAAPDGLALLAAQEALQADLEALQR